jgi:hypothetical protein
LTLRWRRPKSSCINLSYGHNSSAFWCKSNLAFSTLKQVFLNYFFLNGVTEFWDFIVVLVKSCLTPLYLH